MTFEFENQNQIWMHQTNKASPICCVHFLSRQAWYRAWWKGLPTVDHEKGSDRRRPLLLPGQRQPSCLFHGRRWPSCLFLVVHVNLPFSTCLFLLVGVDLPFSIWSTCLFLTGRQSTCRHPSTSVDVHFTALFITPSSSRFFWQPSVRQESKFKIWP